MTIPAVLAFEIEESVEWVETEESDAGGADVVDETSAVFAGALAIVEAAGQWSADVDADGGEGRHAQRSEHSDGRMPNWIRVADDVVAEH